MAALTLANIPNHINTFERLLVFAAQALQSSANGLTVAAVAGQGVQPACQVQVAVLADNTPRFVVSAYVPCDLNGLNSATEKTWMAANDLATAAPNAVFGTN